ncbi:MAG TPA: alpha/beta hydrolase [Candidatus Binatia bacterium]|jgi:pimeloyl-ACP methyl ester carboxylesterase
MRTYVGGIAVEITRPESAKFRHPLLLVHGLWTGSWVWEPVATYLAHRGWESWAPSVREVAELPARTRAVEAVARALPEPPVVITHDAGLVVAAPLAAAGAAVALAALAPVIGPGAGRGRGLFGWPQFWLARVFGTSVAPPGGAGAEAYLGRAVASRDRLRPDSASVFRALASGTVAIHPSTSVPGLVVTGGDDAIVRERDARAVAERLGWAERTLPGRGHFALLEPGWEALADEVHRWIVRTLGADLLLFLDDESGGDPL